MMYAVFTVFLVLPVVAVALRLVSRRISRVNLWWDDWLILVALVVSTLSFVSRRLTVLGYCHFELRVLGRM